MKDKAKTREQLITELEDMRQRITELEASEAERKRVEEALSDSEKRYRHLVELCPDTIAVHTEGKITYINPAGVRLMGAKKAEQLIGKPIMDFLYPDYRGMVEDRIMKVGKQAIHAPLMAEKFIRLDGEIIDVEVTAIPFTYQGKPAIQAVVRDITERKAAEAALRESEEFSTSLLRNAPNPVMVINPDTSIRYTNPALEKLTGFSSAELIGRKAPYPWWTETERQQSMAAFEKCMRKGLYLREKLHLKKSGEKFWVEIISVPVKDNGKLKYFLLNWVDITERKKAEEALRESEEFSTSLLRNAPNPVTVINPDTSIRYVNPAHEKLTGFSSAELIGRKAPYPYWMPEKFEEHNAQFKKAMRQGAYLLETLFRKKNGERFWVEITSVPVRDSGKLKYFLSNWVDITERKQAEESLKIYQYMVESAHDAIFFKDLDSRYIVANNKTLEAFGLSREEVLGKNDYEIMPDREEASKNIEDDQHVFKTGNSKQITKLMTGASGEKYWFEAIKVPQFDEEGHINGLIGVARDITERKRAEELTQNRLKFEKVVSALSSRFVAPADIDEAINQSLADIGRLSGASRAYLFLFREGGTIADNTHEWCAEGVSREIEKNQNVHTETMEWMANIQLGDLVQVEDVSRMLPETSTERAMLERQSIKSLLLSPVYDSGGKIVGYLGFDNVVSTGRWSDDAQTLLRMASVTIGNAIGRKRAEEALRESEEKLRLMFESVTEGITVTDLNGVISDVNDAALRLSGYGSKVDLIGKSSVETIASRDREKALGDMQNLLRQGVAGMGEYNLVRADGSEYPAEINASVLKDASGNPVGFIAIIRDITEHKRLEEERQRADRFESIGILAGGIAHDFNNMLTGILGNIGLASKYAEPESKTSKRLEEAEKAALRAKDLTQQLLTFTRGGVPLLETASLSALIRDSATFALRGSNVSCDFSLPDDLWPVEVDKGQISQVISNLVINADQSMPGGGVLKIRAQNIITWARSALPLDEGKYVEITIEDHGVGIPKVYLQKIFDPYFTTKQKGSGLGLSTVYSVVKNHSGCITVESELGVGTTFHIYLPASQKKVPGEKEEVVEISTADKGRILAMDDDEAIRELLYNELTGIGYEVELAGDGAEAIELYLKAGDSGQSFDAVILDLTVQGGMGGKEAIEWLLEMDPGVNAIVSSGYSTDHVMNELKEYGFRDVVVKPYKIAELEKVIRRVIMGKGEQAGGHSIQGPEIDRKSKIH